MILKIKNIWAYGIVLMLLTGTTAPSSAALDAADRTLYAAADSLQRGLTLLGKSADSFSLAQGLREEPGLETSSSVTAPGIALSEDSGVSTANLDTALVQIASERGVAARALAGLTARDLKNLPGPTILRVRAAEDSDTADHYILLERVDGDQAIIWASRLTGESVPLLDLTALWRGDAVLLASDEAELDRVATQAGANTWGPIGVALVLGLGLFTLGLRLNSSTPTGTLSNTWRRRLLRIAVQAAALIAVVGGGASIYALGFARDHVASARAESEHVSQTFIDFRDEQAPVTDYTSHDLTKDQLFALLANTEVQWVDARSRTAFEQDHLSGAILLDRFDASTVRLRLAGIPRDTALVVYCINIDCGRGRAASAALAKAGFLKVYHYPPGWVELRDWDALQYRESAHDR